MINLTPHDIVLRRADRTDLVIPASGELARVSVVYVLTGEVVCGVPVVSMTPGPVTGLQRSPDGVPMPCIVSGMVRDALPRGTKNVWSPDTGPTAIRNPAGQVIAVTRLIAA